MDTTNILEDYCSKSMDREEWKMNCPVCQVSGVIRCKAEMWSRSQSLGLETVSKCVYGTSHLGLVSVSCKSGKFPIFFSD